MVRQIEQPDGVLIFDDTIQEKPFSKENALISWHFDHTKNRTVKGINLLNCVCHAGEVTKNHHFRELLHVSCQNKLSFQYVLADSWFCSKDNMNFIRHDCDKHFIMAAKSNRLISLSEEDKKQGRSQRTDTVNFPEDRPVRGWIAGISFPVLLFRQIFKNKDGSSGIL